MVETPSPNKSIWAWMVRLLILAILLALMQLDQLGVVLTLGGTAALFPAILLPMTRNAWLASAAVLVVLVITLAPFLLMS